MTLSSEMSDASILSEETDIDVVGEGEDGDNQTRSYVDEVAQMHDGILLSGSPPPCLDSSTSTRDTYKPAGKNTLAQDLLREHNTFIPAAAAYGYGPYGCGGYGIQLQSYHTHSALFAFQQQQQQQQHSRHSHTHSHTGTIIPAPSLMPTNTDLARSRFYPQLSSSLGSASVQAAVPVQKSSSPAQRSPFSIESIIGGSLSPSRTSPVVVPILPSSLGPPVAGQPHPGAVLHPVENFPNRVVSGTSGC
ncbi:forkhead box protein D1 [Scomber scombrus]|uniref:Forkhead box protein D1 n=1 Tax=Scomber scombrus TaxID=13677 RepID=A0AAV1NZN5_SCOSC